jgi:hypothetical protein
MGLAFSSPVNVQITGEQTKQTMQRKFKLTASAMAFFQQRFQRGSPSRANA